MQPRKIFLSYRREDSAGEAGRLNDRLVSELGNNNVFMDVDGIPLGTDFVKRLTAEVASCDVLLAIIGKSWLDIRDEEGNRRLDDPNDFVRVEIGAALKRDILVIPILLNGARIPRADRLPQDLQGLAVRNGLDLRHASFHADAGRLIRELGRQPQAVPDDGNTAASWRSPGNELPHPAPRASVTEPLPKAAITADRETPKEKTEFTVVLTAAANNRKISVIKEVRAITGLGLKEAKDLVEGAPKPLKERVNKDEADGIRAQLEEAGAKVELKATPKEKTEFTVVLAAAGDKKIEVIRQVRIITGLGLKDAKDLVEGAPKPLKERVNKDEADEIRAQLERVGARVKLK